MRRRRVRIAGPGCAASRHSGCLQDAFRFRQHPVLESLRLRQGLHRCTDLPLRRGVPSRRHARNLQSVRGLRHIWPSRDHPPADPGEFLSGPARGSHRPRPQGANTAKHWHRSDSQTRVKPGRTGGSTPLNPAQPGVEPTRRMTQIPSTAPTCTVIARIWRFWTEQERSVESGSDPVNPVRLGDSWAAMSRQDPTPATAPIVPRYLTGGAGTPGRLSRG
jgi:hypothetical protein